MEDQLQYRHAYETTMRPDTPQEAAARLLDLPSQEYMLSVQAASVAGKLIQRYKLLDPCGGVWQAMWPTDDNRRILWNWAEFRYRVAPEGEPTPGGGLRRWRVVQYDYGRAIRMAHHDDLASEIQTVELVTRAVP